MKKVDYKKEDKLFYLPKETPSIVQLPAFTFVCLKGEGDPNESEFGLATAALYSFSYAVKMSYKSLEVPQGYYDYTVYPLEGVWDLIDRSKSSKEKSNYAYEIMMRQPQFLTQELFERFQHEAKKKTHNPHLERLKLVAIEEGLCCQMLHKGSYDTEPESFQLMMDYCKANGFERIDLTHREIYLSDPRKTESSKLKTVLRFKVKSNNEVETI